MADVYRDYFTRENLLASVIKAPYVPGQLAPLFQTLALTSTTAAFEELALDSVSVGSAIPRGAPPAPLSLETRKVHTFPTASYGWSGAVLADEVLGRRGDALGLEMLTQRVDLLTAKLRRQADLQHEYLRVACVLAASNAFGSRPSSQAIALATDGTKTRAEIFSKIISPLETALGGLAFTGVKAWCSDTFWAALIENKAIKDSYVYTTQAATLRNDPRELVTFGGVTFERYRGTGSAVMTAGSALVIPEGVSGLFYQAFAPNDTIDSVGAGAAGEPYYLLSEELPARKGWKLTLQTHPVMVCTRPAVLLEITLS